MLTALPKEKRKGEDIDETLKDCFVLDPNTGNGVSRQLPKHSPLGPSS